MAERPDQRLPEPKMDPAGLYREELFTDRKVDSATFAKAVAAFGQRGTMDMVAVMNTYAVSGFYAIAVDEHSPEGKPALERSK